jgi:hypothetical protein
MLFMQVGTPGNVTVPGEAEVAQPRSDPRSTRDSSYESQRPPDDRTTRDSAYDTRREDERAREEDEGREPGLRPNPAFGGIATARSAASGGAGEDEFANRLDYGTDWLAQIALTQGYNDNVVQTQDAVNGPVTKHPAPFTGADMTLTLRTWSSSTDLHELRLNVRGAHYEPLEKFSEPDDGAVIGSYQSAIALGKRDTLQLRAISTLATLNASRLSDGPLFLVEPGSLQRTYTLSNARASLVHEISERWRYAVTAEFEFSTTIDDQPIDLGTGQAIKHHGLDYYQPTAEFQLGHDLGKSDILTFVGRYSVNENVFLIDFNQVPPRAAGTGTTHIADLAATLTHSFTDRLELLTTGGAVASSAPPLDPDNSVILSPLWIEQLLYLTEYWIFDASASYTYGSASPRLGFGPAATAAMSLSGVPFPRTPTGRKFAILANATASRAAFRATTDAVSRISYYIASVDLRFSLTNWLGLLAGYNVRYATYEGANSFPALLRNVAYVGVGGYFATDRSLPTISTFQQPLLE